MEKSNENGINKAIVEERRKLRDHLMVEFPDAEVTVKSCCDREIAEVKLNGSNSADAIDKVDKIKERALPKLPFIRVRDLDSGFSLEGPSPSHILAMLQD
ncbi:MAG: hypothetical protein AAB793_01450 [Patescibacteria group bacterium]